jgi:uncharacterized protein YcfJ
MEVIMKNVRSLLVIFLLFAWPATLLHAQDPIVYPAKGQSEKKMEQDKFTCYDWAKKQTGFDPMKVPTTTTPPPEKKATQGGAVKGAAAGALIGVAAGAAGGDAGKGAAVGAAAGGTAGALKQRSTNKKSEQEQAQWEQKESAAYANKRSEYNRAYSACLEGKGYTVK